MARVDSFDVQVSLGNAAMDSHEDVARALREVADKVESGDYSGRVRDDNGNSVGAFSFRLAPGE
jgi:hypothetical protein